MKSPGNGGAEDAQEEDVGCIQYNYVILRYTTTILLQLCTSNSTQDDRDWNDDSQDEGEEE